MIQYKKNIGITLLFIFCIIGVAYLIDKVAVNRFSTLEQMLSGENRALISHYRQLFRAESEPVIIAIQGVSAIQGDRIAAIEKALRSIADVSGTLSSVSMRQYGFSNDKLFSLQNNTKLILLMIQPGIYQLDESKELSQSIKIKVDSLLTADESVFITGQPQIRAASWDITAQDLKLILPLLVAVTVLVTLLFFYSYIALALSLLLTSLTTLACLGLHLLLNAELNMILVLAVPIIWAVSTLDAFHIYNRTVINACKKITGPEKAASRELFMPCLLTTVTTAGCFLTLTILDTSPLIITFGLWCAAGTVIAFILTFTLGEKLLTLLAFNKTARWPAAFSFNIVSLAQQHHLVILIFWGALALLSLLYLPQLQLSTSYPQVFTEDKSIARDINHISDLTGSDLNAIDIILEADDLYGEDVASMANAVLLMRNYLKTIDETRLILPMDLVSKDDLQSGFNRWQLNGKGRSKTSSDYRDGLMYWVSENKHSIRLQVYLAKTSFDRRQQIFNWLEHFDETMLSHHKVILSGTAYFYHLTEKQGLNSLLLSSIFSLLILLVTLYWLTGNGIQALIALSGSVVPAILLAGGMAMLNIPWSIAMLPLPAVLLGLMNDDAIHMIWSVRQSRRFSNRQFRSNALNAGPALLATTLVLSCAVGILILSGIQTNQYLGVLIPAGLLLAYFCNLSLVPALNSWLHKSARSTG